MNPLPLLRCLALLTLANVGPIVAKKVFGARLVWALDGGRVFFDGRPLLGPSKTVRGIVCSLLVTPAGSVLMGVGPEIGVLVAGTAMAGDLFSSFVKRRLGLKPSSQALGLDQVPESLFPLLASGHVMPLTGLDIAAGVTIFVVGELVFSRLLYKAHLRDEPY